jgi:hypothetical protein
MEALIGQSACVCLSVCLHAADQLCLMQFTLSSRQVFLWSCHPPVVQCAQALMGFIYSIQTTRESWNALKARLLSASGGTWLLQVNCVCRAGTW